MATISFNVTPANLSRLEDVMAERGGYSATLADGEPNPQTKAQFAKSEIARIIKDVVREYELAVARSAVTVSEVTLT